MAFVDLARAFAILMMLQGHTLHAVLTTDVRGSEAFHAWSFVRGLTSCTFLVLSGLTFTLATYRHWGEHVVSSREIVRRFRRFGLFLVLGYALHFPAAKLAQLPGVGPGAWQRFLAVDVLQCIAVMLAALQILALLARHPRRFGIAAAVGAAVIVALTPFTWRTDWTGTLPAAIVPYLSSATGSQFPLLPWGAYVLLGAALGALYLRFGMARLPAFTNRVLFAGGAGMLALALIGARLPFQPFGPADFWSTSPNQFLLRAGLVLLILGVIARVSIRRQSPLIARALAHESLTIYTVHLCIVYGSVWNVGLAQLFGPRLPLLPAIMCVLVVWTAMTLLALAWWWCKHSHPAAAQWVRGATFGGLLGKLL